MNSLLISIYLLLNYAEEALPKTFTGCSAILKSRYLFYTSRRKLCTSVRFFSTPQYPHLILVYY
jgi:hypothetical protein